MNDRAISLVFGYLPEVDYPNPRALQRGVTQRFAVVLHTSRADRAEMYFDSELFVAVLNMVLDITPYTEVRLCMDAAGQEILTSIAALQQRYTETAEEDREPFQWAEILEEKRIIGYLETEWYVRVGGPSPYHDSYTLSVYLAAYDRSRIQQQVLTLCHQLNVDLIETCEGLDTPQVALLTRIRHKLQ